MFVQSEKLCCMIMRTHEILILNSCDEYWISVS
jgi:hypothetical protein